MRRTGHIRTIFVMKQLLLAFILLFASSCEKRPLVDPSNTHYVRVYIDEEISNVTKGFYNPDHARPVYNPPTVMRVILADPETGDAKAERFLRNMGEDETGRYYDGYIVADPGRYILMAYNFDTESTIISESNNLMNAKAYTNEIAPHLKTRIASRSKAAQEMSDSEQQSDSKAVPERIVYDPDHLFASNCGEIHIPYIEHVDTLRTEDGGWFHAKSIVKSYYLQIRVKGMQFVTSSVGLMTGLAGSSWVNGTGMDESDPVTVYFDMQPGENAAAGVAAASGEDDGATVYTTFSTFGKIPDAENELFVTFDFMTIYGETHSETINITPVFTTEEAVRNQWLLLDHVYTIEIPPPPPVTGSGGGFSPGLEDWGDINADINI